MLKDRSCLVFSFKKNLAKLKGMVRTSIEAEDAIDNLLHDALLELLRIDLSKLSTIGNVDTYVLTVVTEKIAKAERGKNLPQETTLEAC